MFVWGKESLRENCIHVPFCKCRSKISEQIFTFYIAVACTNCSMKNSNLSIHKYVISGCKILRVRNSFLRTSISVLHILKKRIDGKYDYGFLCALKLHSQLWENFCTLRMMKNAFYFTSNALFVLKISKFLSTAWLKR